jgi:hypothetical protein
VGEKEIEMNEAQKAQLRASLIKAIQEWSDQDEVIEAASMWWAPNTVAHMADAALIVIVAAKETQEEMEAKGAYGSHAND